MRQGSEHELDTGVRIVVQRTNTSYPTRGPIDVKDCFIEEDGRDRRLGLVRAFPTNLKPAQDVELEAIARLSDDDFVIDLRDYSDLENWDDPGEDGAPGTDSDQPPFLEGLPPPADFPQVVGTFTFDEMHCVVTEAMGGAADGASPGSMVIESTLDAAARLDLAVRLARSMAYVHHHNVILGRFEPNSFHWTQSQNSAGRLWITDFGEALLAENASVARDAPDANRDVLDLARTITQLLTGRMFEDLFDDEKPPNADLTATLDPPLHPLWLFLHRTGVDSAATLLEKSPADWFATALAEIVDAFEWPLEQEGIDAGLVNLVTRLKGRSDSGNHLVDGSILSAAMSELKSDTTPSALASRAEVVAKVGHMVDKTRPSEDEFVTDTLASLAISAADSLEVWDHLDDRKQCQLLGIELENRRSDVAAVLAYDGHPESVIDHLKTQLRPGTRQKSTFRLEPNPALAEAPVGEVAPPPLDLAAESEDETSVMDVNPAAAATEEWWRPILNLFDRGYSAGNVMVLVLIALVGLTIIAVVISELLNST